MSSFFLWHLASSTDSPFPCSLSPSPVGVALSLNPWGCYFLYLEYSSPFSVFIQVQFVSVSQSRLLAASKKAYSVSLEQKRKVPRRSHTDEGP